MITGVDYAVNRYYNLGRFTQVDPVGMSLADLTNPQSLNLYSYTRNDPMNLLDPSGLDPAAVCFQDITITGDGTTYGPTQCAAFNTPSDATYNALYNADPTADFFFGRTIGGSAGAQGIVARGAGAWNIGSFVSSYLGYSGPTIPKTTARATTALDRAFLAWGQFELAPLMNFIGLSLEGGAVLTVGSVDVAAGGMRADFWIYRESELYVSGTVSSQPGMHAEEIIADRFAGQLGPTDTVIIQGEEHMCAYGECRSILSAWSQMDGPDIFYYGYTRGVQQLQTFYSGEGFVYAAFQ